MQEPGREIFGTDGTNYQRFKIPPANDLYSDGNIQLFFIEIYCEIYTGNLNDGNYFAS